MIRYHYACIYRGGERERENFSVHVFKVVNVQIFIKCEQKHVPK